MLKEGREVPEGDCSSARDRGAVDRAALAQLWATAPTPAADQTAEEEQEEGAGDQREGSEDESVTAVALGVALCVGGRIALRVGGLPDMRWRWELARGLGGAS